MLSSGAASVSSEAMLGKLIEMQCKCVWRASLRKKETDAGLCSEDSNIVKSRAKSRFTNLLKGTGNVFGKHNFADQRLDYCRVEASR